MPTKRRRRTPWAAIVIAALVAAALVAGFTWSRVTEKSVTFRVTRVLDRATSSCSKHGCHTRHKYLVFTDHGTYQDTDAFWFLKFSSSDLIGQLRDGHSYRCDTTGFRLALASHYRNLIHCSAVAS